MKILEVHYDEKNDQTYLIVIKGDLPSIHLADALKDALNLINAKYEEVVEEIGK